MFISDDTSWTKMAKILVGGPEGEHKNIHDSLVARLKQEHEVTYVKNNGPSMFWELAKTPLTPKEQRYNLVLYDSDLFYPGTNAEKKTECFETCTSYYLAKSEASVIILAEIEIATRLKPSVEKAGFIQIDEPYNIDKVIYVITEILDKNNGEK